MPSGTSSTVEANPTTVPLSTVFRADDADVVIRAAGTLDFRVHKPILSLVSPVFKDMFTLPQPPTNPPSALSRVDIGESPGPWENILRTIYPMPNPIIDDLDDLESLLLAAKKYDMQFVIDSYIKSFESRDFIQRDLLHLYAIACACGFDDQAKYVAKYAERLVVTRRSNAGNLKGLTVESYHRLVSFLAERDNEWYQTLGKIQTPYNSRCRCDGPDKNMLYNNVKSNFKVAHFQADEVYLKALEDPIRPSTCGSGDGCMVVASRIKAFIEQRVKEREAVCEKFMW